MTINPHAKALLEHEIGWTAKPRKATPRVSVELGGKSIGGPLPADEAISKMYAVWEALHATANELKRLDDLIRRQEEWLDRNAYTVSANKAFEAFQTMKQNIDTRETIWRDRLPQLEKQADRIVEKMDGGDVEHLTKVHAWAPLGGFGLRSRFQELTTELGLNVWSMPEEDCPF